MSESSNRSTRWPLVLAGLLVVAGWPIMVLLRPGGPPTMLSQFLAGILLGTMFGQVSLAAAWCVLSPLALVQRLPIALAWLLAINLAISCSILLDQPEVFALFVVNIALCVQWILIQMPIWFIVVRFGLGLRHQDSIAPGNARQQFGIRQLMVLTVGVAVFLGVGRLIVSRISWQEADVDWRMALIFGFLAVSCSLISFPPIVAALIERRAAWAIGGALGLVALVTAMEIPLMRFLSPSTTKEDWLIGWMNAIQSVWILGILLLVRSAGYRLSTR
jgi:hypothetical protein